MKVYQDFLSHIIKNGVYQTNRTDINTYSTFGYQYRVDVSKGFPLLTTKKMHLKSIIVELLWFLKGDTNIKYLIENNCRIWNEWPFENFKNSEDYNGESMTEFVEKLKSNDDFCYKYGDLGPVYGHQWRHFESEGKVCDQITEVIEQIKTNPRSRRLIVNAWNPARIKDMALPPCHMMFQFYVSLDNKLSLQLYQRSADAFLGVPFNIASYSLLLMMVAKVTGLEVGEFIHVIGDAHIYENHMDQVKLQLTREPLKLSRISFPFKESIFDYEVSDFTLEDYESHEMIKGIVAV